MNVIAFDFETFPIAPGCQIPRAVCMSFAGNSESFGVVCAREGIEILRSILLGDAHLVGANVAFDASVSVESSPEPQKMLDLWIDAIDAGRVHDVLIRQKLLDLANGCYGWREVRPGVRVAQAYNLGAVAARTIRRPLDKANPWRVAFGALAHLTPAQYPREAYDYALADATSTLAVYAHQDAARYACAHFPGRDALASERGEIGPALALTATSAYGLRTDADAVDSLEIDAVRDHEALRDRLQQFGLISMKVTRHRDHTVSVAYARDTKSAARRMVFACEEIKREVLRTDGYDPSDPKKSGDNCVALDADACEQSGDILLREYAEYSSLAKTISTDIPLLRAGTDTPIHTYFNTLRETGRTSSSKPNVQNVRRLPGIRECFTPRAGCVYVSADYGRLELHTFAQVCLWTLGQSKMAEALNAGNDPHLQMAATILRISYAEAEARLADGDQTVADARTAGKGVNFGAPGGLGKKTFAEYAWSNYGIRITETEAAQLIAQYKVTWPEAHHYFRWIESLKRGEGHDVVQPYSGRLRAGATYCSACNSPFQGLGADCAKLAMWLVFQGCHRPGDPLEGCHIVNFVHDEIILEADESRARGAAQRLGELMNLAGRTVLPDVPVRAEPMIARQWSKLAKPTHDESGQLIPWDIYAACKKAMSKSNFEAKKWPGFVVSAIRSAVK